MTVKAIAMLVALAATFGIFAWSAWKKTMVLLKAKPDNTRFDQVWRRIEEVLSVAVGQRKMFKEPLAGLMHALIFWGFLLLLFRSVSLVGQAFSPEWTIFWFSETLENWYTLAKDLAELAVLTMIGFAFFRRFVLKPWRISLSWDANLVLFLIGFLMLSDFLMDGAKFVVTSGTTEEAWAPVGAAVAAVYKAAGMGEGPAAVVAETFYWLHIAALFFFLNYLPYSKHMHVLTVIQNVFFVNLRPGKALRPIKDIENQESFGAGKIEDYTWKDILDIYTCTECGRCMTNCPTTLTDKTLRPKDLTERQKHYLPKVEPVILGKKPEEERKESLIDVSQYDAIWDCTTCASCEENCPQQIEYVGRIIEMRRYLLLMESNNPKELNVTLRGLENKSNPWGLAMGDRARWAKEDKVPTFAEKPDAEYLLYLGCAASYDDRSIKVARALVRLLDAAGVSFAILGESEGCCGDQARRVGNEYLAQMQAQANIEMWKELGIRKVITLCPHGYQMIKNEYPELGGTFQVVHHTELLHDLVSQGRLKPRKDVSGRVTFHDSCYLGRYNHIYDQPRKLLDQVPGLTRVEMDRHRETGFCCGAGGGRVWMEEHKGTRINQYRIDQAMEVQPDTVVSACPFCLMMFRDGIAEKGFEERLKARDIAEILADSCL
ncbi:MAG: (Fe-S)-binding protein [Deltaproteobacteria bacterium]|nr:(Fe-S)-binding protein [Deltaproteobacteria bacterium]